MVPASYFRIRSAQPTSTPALTTASASTLAPSSACRPMRLLDCGPWWRRCPWRRRRCS